MTSPLTIFADNSDLKALACFSAESADNPQLLRPRSSADDAVDQDTSISPMTNLDHSSCPWHTGVVLPQSQFWPCQAPANVQHLGLVNEPIPIAYTEYASNDQVDQRLVPTSVAAGRPRGQISLGELPEEQMTRTSVTSGSSAVDSQLELKARRRTSSEGHVPAPAITCSTRTPHNLIERRYRHKLQSELDNLTSKIPGWETEISNGVQVDIENAEKPLKSRSKASAIAAAAKYIECLERDNKSKALFVEKLQGQVEGLQKLVHCDDCDVLRYLQDSRIAPGTKQTSLLFCYTPKVRYVR